MKIEIDALSSTPKLKGIGSYAFRIAQEFVARHRLGRSRPELPAKRLASDDFRKVPAESRDALQRVLGQIERSYSIAFAPRSGSNHLCDLLMLAGIGRPTEYFQYELPHWKVPDLALAMSDVLHQNTVDGVFGSKVAHDHRAWLQSVIGGITDRKGQLGDALPNHRWIRLVRQDKIAQAVSLYTAQVSQQWLIWQDDRKSDVEVPYDFSEIMARYHTVMTAELAWDVYFSEYDINPLVVTYEELVERPQQTIAAIAAELAVNDWRPVQGVGANLRVQRNKNTASLVTQFRRDLIDIGNLHS